MMAYDSFETGHEFCGLHAARDWFGMPWAIRIPHYTGFAELDFNAQYNDGWVCADAYAQLQGYTDQVRVQSLKHCCAPPTDCAFHCHIDWSGYGYNDYGPDDCSCAIAVGRYGKGHIGAFPGESSDDCYHVLASMAKIPAVIVWSEVRLLILAFMQPEGSAPARICTQNALLSRFFQLEARLAELILHFAFGPVSIPDRS